MPTPWMPLSGLSRCLALMVLAAGFLLGASVQADSPAEAAPTDAAAPLPTTPGDLSSLAQAGRFDQVLANLQSDAHLAAKAPAVASLVSDIRRYDQHRTLADAQRKEAYGKALDKMRSASSQDKLDEAIGQLLEAGTLADDRKAMLAEPDVVALVQKTTAAADAAVAGDDWLEALMLYRELEAVFEDRTTYHDQARNAERQVRLLRLYAPAKLQTMFQDRAKRLGNEKAESLTLGGETWEQTLDGVDMTKLRQALVRAARDHVTSPGFAPLVLGALDNMRAVAQASALADAFPNLADKDKVQRFDTGLDAIVERAKRQQAEMNFTDADRLFNQVSDLNNETITLPQKVVVYELADGMLSPLDEFSSVIWPREKEEFSRNTQGKFYGVGIQISRRDGQLLVVSPLEGTPAQRAGIKAGDVIATVNGESTTGWSLDRAVRTITGPEGTPVTLGIKRVGDKDLSEYKINRAEIVIESVKGWEHQPQGGWDYFIDGAQKIGYIRLSQFIPQSADDIDAAVNAMEKHGGVNALILDLRYNPGGLLTSAIDVADRFINSGVIVDTVGPNGERTGEARAKPHKTYPAFPVVVLVNEGSASASEIVSGALQAHDRATIIGMRTFGKGSVQDLYKLDGGNAYLKLTTQYYRLPNGQIIHRKPDAGTWGIEPDIAIKMTPKQLVDLIEFRQNLDVIRDTNVPTTQPAASASDMLEKGLDPQLEAALLVLKTHLVADQIAIARGNTVVPVQ
ncbi:MAG: S41 family peptidase [Phycisphaeraceae bacterium]